MTVYHFLFCVFVLGTVNSQGAWKQFFSSNLNEMEDVPITFNSPLPPWLKGTLIRNGMGRFEVGNEKFLSALDAFGKLASWKFKGDGTAYFTTKLVRSKGYNESVATNSIAPYLMLDAVQPPWSLEKKVKALMNGPDNMNVNVKNFGRDKNDFGVISDYWNLYTFDPYTLDTLDAVRPDLPNGPDKGSAIVLSTAHPIPEYGTNNHLTLMTHSSIDPLVKIEMTLERMKSSSEREVVTIMKIDRASYMHSFAVTEHYAIIVAMPFFVDPIGVLKSLKPLDAFKWEPSAKTTLYIINLNTTKTTVIQTESIFFLHIINAYESDLFTDEIIIDLCTYNDTRNMHSFDFSVLKNKTYRADSPESAVKRLTINLSKGSATVEKHTSKSGIPFANKFDFPTINENYRSKPYCYTYGIVYNVDGKDFLHMAIVKKDVCHGTNERYWQPSGKFLNEAYFVPSPGATEEDDGVVMLPVYDTFTNTTEFTILDGKDLSVITTAKLPTNIPFGTHGYFFDNIF